MDRKLVNTSMRKKQFYGYGWMLWNLFNGINIKVGRHVENAFLPPI